MDTIFVANRGEIALRVIRTARLLGYRTVGVCSRADRDLPYVHAADRIVAWDGPSDARSTYLDGPRVIAAARAAGADAVHPGYGFLSENAVFAEQVLDAGLEWIGPPPAAIRALGDKAAGRALARANGVPVLPGTDDPAAISSVGFPILIKAAAGGGGRGMRRVDAPDALDEALAAARREALAAFGDDRVLFERYLARPRHVEIQILADAHGTVLALGERECSVQRRHQKVIEEAPSPVVDVGLRVHMEAAAVSLARAGGYVGAGTMEFLLDEDRQFYFLEANTRLQVEHPVTELVTGLDLVEWQLRIAEGEYLPSSVHLQGHAIEARLYAEDALNDYVPGTGRLHRLELPDLPGIRIDAGYRSGDEISPFYDAMIAKIIAFGPDRRTATRRLRRAVELAWAPGVVTNLPLLRQILADPAWDRAELDTAFLGRTGLPVAPPLNLARGALAAAVLGYVQRRAGLVGPPGWRSFGRAEQVDRYRCGTQVVTLSYLANPDGLVAQVDGQTLEVRDVGLDGDVLALTVDGVVQKWRVCWVPSSPTHRAVDDNDLVYAHFGDGEAFVSVEPRFPAPPAAAATPGQCTAPTPGKVAAVHVAVGDAVEAGQRVVTLEAMKMEHPIAAAEAGVVREVRVEVGQLVDGGTLLVVVEPG